MIITTNPQNRDCLLGLNGDQAAINKINGDKKKKLFPIDQKLATTSQHSPSFDIKKIVIPPACHGIHIHRQRYIVDHHQSY